MEETMDGTQGVVIVPARMESRRLSGRPLLPLGNATVLDQIFRRICAAQFGVNVVVITTETEADRPVRDFCVERGVRFLTERNGDMLDCVLYAAEVFSSKIVVFCPDSKPFLLPRMLDACAQYALESGCDYVTVGRLPQGVASEAMPVKTLQRIADMTRAPEHRNRITEFAAAHPDLFERAYLPAPPRFSRPEVRLLLETPEDYRFLCRLHNDLAPGAGRLLSLEDIFACLDSEIELKKAA